MTDDDQSTSTDKELQKLERQMTIATKWRELLNQLLPKGEAKPLEGKIETDVKSGYTAELVAYQAVKELAGDVVARLAKLDDELIRDARVLIVDKLEYATGDPPFLEMESLLDSLQKAIEAQHKDNADLLKRGQADAQSEALIPAVAMLTAAPAVISALTDVASFFRSNYKIAGKEFDIKTEGLLAAFAGEVSTNDKLRNKGVEVVIPNFYLIDQSEILNSYNKVREGALDLKKDKERLLEVKERSETAAQLMQLKDELNAAIQSSEVLAKSIEALSETITAQADGQQSRLAQAVVRERVRSMKDKEKEKKITHLLWLGSISSGGEAITEDNLIFDDEWGFLGGAVVAFVLARRDGQILAADTLVRLGAFPQKVAKKFFKYGADELQYILASKDERSDPDRK